jgi:hypothetical protein
MMDPSAPVTRAFQDLGACLLRGSGKSRSILVGLVPVAIMCGLTPATVSAAPATNRVVIEGMVKRGKDFAQDFGSGFTFRLKGGYGRS